MDHLLGQKLTSWFVAIELKFDATLGL